MRAANACSSDSLPPGSNTLPRSVELASLCQARRRFSWKRYINVGDVINRGLTAGRLDPGDVAVGATTQTQIHTRSARVGWLVREH